MPPEFVHEGQVDDPVRGGRPGQPEDLVTRADQLGHDGGADPTGGTGERGYEQTTVAEIAKRAGLTERTFFGHFADKLQVLFWGAGSLRELFVQTVTDAPEGTAPLAAVAAALAARRRWQRCWTSRSPSSES